MKKAVAFVLTAVFAVVLSACGLTPVESGVHTDKTGDGVSYTALDVLAIYLGGDAYEVQFGIKSEAFDGSDPRRIGKETGEIIGAELEYLGNYLTDGYAYFAYKTKGKTVIETKERRFGFFDRSVVYEIASDDTIRNVYGATIDVVKRQTANGYEVDDEAIRLSFGICTDTKFKSENAKQTLINLFSGEETGYAPLQCTVWQSADRNADFTLLRAETSRLSAGWFIVAVALGAVVAAMAMLLGSKRKAAQNASVSVEKIENEEDRDGK